MTSTPILAVRDLAVTYGPPGRGFDAVSDIGFDIQEGETLGLVGESGCGKSSLGRAILQLPGPSRGSVRLNGRELSGLTHQEMRPLRTELQVIFQDPISSLNPRRRIKDIVAEPLDIAGIGSKQDRYAKVAEMLRAVGIDPEAAMERRPHQFSGGQCQRICIARALISNPKLIVCDEPVSALDVSVQAQTVNLLEDLKAQFGLTLLFISHDLAVVKHISDRVAVMYLGRLCELTESQRLFREPAHPYTAGLIATIPAVERDRAARHRAPLEGELPSPVNKPSGCYFRTRCPVAKDICSREVPDFREVAEGHHVACHFPLSRG